MMTARTTYGSQELIGVLETAERAVGLDRGRTSRAASFDLMIEGHMQQKQKEKSHDRMPEDFRRTAPHLLLFAGDGGCDVDEHFQESSRQPEMQSFCHTLRRPSP